MNKKTTKKALFSSVVALILCFSMLVGTTFAWFTDEVESGLNQIVAGNLDVELYHTNTKDNNEKVTTETKLFDEVNPQLWEPGAVAFENLTVTNEGTLALKYQLSINFENATVVNGHSLAEALKVGVVEGGIQGTTRDAVLAEVKTWQPLESFSLSGELAGKVEAEGKTTIDSAVYGIVIYWEPGDNEFDNLFNMNNENKGRVLSIDLGVHLFATQLSAESDSFDEYYDGAANWLGGVDTDWYFENPDATEYTIGTAEQLAGLAAIVNGTAVAPATTFAATAPAAIQDGFVGKTIKLSSDINLNNLPWTPIGNWDNTFEGTFDGNGHTIYNLYINAPEGEDVGFFGVTQKATIKGITLENVDISAYSMVAGLVGAAYPANISDCHIAGDVEIVAEWAYVAGIAGYCYYGTQVDGCSVIAEDTGLIQSVTRNAVGGITAWLLEGNHNVTNCQVKNLNLVGWTNVGGITGFVHYNNTIEGCSVENVTLTKTRADGNPGIGLIAGGWSYSASNAITLRNNTIKNATLSGTHIAYAAYNELYGSEYGGATTTNFVLKNNTTTDIVNNLVEVSAATTLEALQAAIDAAKDGDIIVISKDMTGDLTVTQKPDVKITIDGNGKTFAGTIVVDGKSATYTTAGLTLKNFNFKANSISADACINLGNGTNATRYTCNVTVDSCTFDVPGAVGVKSYTGGDKNLTITNCTATANAHSLVQAKGIDGVLVKNCEVYSKNGLNFNNSTNVTVSGCTVDVKGYAVRFGESSGGTGAAETYKIENCTLKSANDDGDAVVILRGTADNSTLTINNTTLTGDIQIKDTASNATIIIDGKYYVSTAAELAAVVAAGATDIYLLDGEYDVYGCGGKTLTISGSKNAVIKLYNDGEDGCDYAFGGNGTGVGNITFNGLTIDTTANTGNYKGFAYMKGIFNDCNFVGAYSLNNANDFEFNRCTFDFKNGYFWTWGANSVTFDGCTFNGNSKNILAHGYASTVININNCTFAATEKGYTGAGDNTAAVEIDPAGTNTYTINFTGENTITENYAGWTRVKDGSTGHTITGLN